MVTSSEEAEAPPKRPPAMARQSSTSSHLSQSLSDGQGPSKPTPHKGPRKHVVGQGRVTRNASGKNLSKLNKAAQAHGGDGEPSRHHHRSQSDRSNSAPSSPRPGFKRNASTGGVIRAAHHQQHTHTAIRKNHSSGHLARLGHSKAVLKASRSEIAPPKKSLAQTGKARARSPEAHATVHFDVGEAETGDDDADDGWTEASASQSPATTRTNTRSNSMILEQPKPAMSAEQDESTQSTETSQSAQASQAVETPPEERSQPPETSHAEHPQPARSGLEQPQANEPSQRRSPEPVTRPLVDRARPAQHNGGNAHHRSRAPDADMITSKLLQRSLSHTARPQVSAVAASVSVGQDGRTRGNSSGSTLVDTPGRDLVSRFMDAGSSGGTPRNSLIPSRGSPQSTNEDFEHQVKRNRSMPNFANAEATGSSTSRTTSTHRRSGATTPTHLPTPSDFLPPSRTQQKLLLQRASSTIEPNRMVPAMLPRSGAPNGYVHAGMVGMSAFAGSGNAEGRIDPRLLQQFNHVNVEYRVVRRYRDPLGDAVQRVSRILGIDGGGKGYPKGKGVDGRRSGRTTPRSGAGSLSASLTEPGMGLGEAELSLRRGRGSFEGEDEGLGRRSFEPVEREGEERRNEAEELCRRLWMSMEVVEEGE
ncbi:hypothetical protein M011DRAFT_469715 [Sporormia fimetaria CBS 119925]|uniref:TORC1 subunit TCO89 domain-containing protein n=1 Tax=Sporormia fimetaria CBS 119925 TaxID=1340428 RepID=A0A6A6V6I6_9PLEO|nr:hypothetical protein M011DRAFT_469715 [Sporormia fimetaria CBS 119925]